MPIFWKQESETTESKRPFCQLQGVKELSRDDPRTIAHDKKADDEKETRRGNRPDAVKTPQPGKKSSLVQSVSPSDRYQQHTKPHPSEVSEEK